jgi:hypothetical protein
MGLGLHGNVGLNSISLQGIRPWIVALFIVKESRPFSLKSLILSLELWNSCYLAVAGNWILKVVAAKVGMQVRVPL